MKVSRWAILILAVATGLAITSAWNDTVIVDEVPHIGAGYSYLARQDMRLNPEHPPLAKDLAALPLLFLNLDQGVFATKQWQQNVNGQWEFGRYLMFNSDNDADLIKHWVKLSILLFFVLAGILIFKWGRQLYGPPAGLIALFFFAFSPTILAHARFVTTDVPALFGILAAAYFFIRYLRNPSRKNFIIGGLIFGVALLTKFSTALLVPYLGLLAIVYGYVQTDGGWKDKVKPAIRQGLMAVGLFTVGLLLVVWPVYYFHVYHYPPARQQSDSAFLLSSFGNRPLADSVVWMADKPVIRALGQYGLGLLMVTQRASGGNTTYFLGEVSAAGWHYYFPVVYFLKEPLAWWLLVIVAVLTATKFFPLRGISRSETNWIKSHFIEFAMLLWLMIYWATSIRSNLNIGVRHLLPTYPFAILLVSGQLSRILDRMRNQEFGIRNKFRKVLIHASRFLIPILLGWYLLENLSVYPYYLTYFNQVAGGPSGGYRYVVDSNLDWGQDLLRLSRWVEDRGIKQIELDYFGWADPAYYLGDRFLWLTSEKFHDEADFKRRNTSDGWLAVSATFLQGSVGTPDDPKVINYNWLKAYTPAAVIGHSIFVYNIR